MKRISPSLRMSAGLASLLVSVLCLAQVMGLLPDDTGAILKGRKSLCEAMAIHCSLAAQRGDNEAIKATTLAIVQRNPDILSAAVRRANGELLIEVGDHQANWTATGTASTPTQVHVPVSLQDRPWGSVELRFPPLTSVGPWAIFRNPALRFISFVTTGCFLLYYCYLRFILVRLKSITSPGMPDRVRSALDTLVEGVLLLDNNQRIALANKAFASTVGQSTADLEGRPVSDFSWMQSPTEEGAGDFPWRQALAEAKPQTGSILELQTKNAGQRTFSVNASPILGEDGTCRGTLATFDDLTVLQKKNTRLKKVLEKLKLSRDAIRQQNDQLRDLARLDPLTSCLNRRSFFEELDVHWNAARRYGHNLSCFILDIDHFKSINDTYGHGVGDQALQHVSGVLKSVLRTTDLLCRYGGEEFCVVLPHEDVEGAERAAERFRRAIETRKYSNISVTASFGVATLVPEVRDPHDLLDQADKALYAAKRSGRNRVVRWDNLPKEAKDAKDPKGNVAKMAPGQKPVGPEAEVSIPFHAVTSLISALAFRDAPTAEHSRRVADLCVHTAKGLLSESESYVLEVAALLHDIGKLGVPDAILRKPGPLTDQEWKVMGAHDRMGEEIITSAFASASLGEIVRTHHAWYGGSPRNPGLPTEKAIPVGARILSIADAFDAMVSDRVYRKGRSREEAFVELRRCAGKQFDPELVEHFIDVMLARDDSRRAAFPSLSKRTAFQIGLQIEKLAGALDAHDMTTLATMASRLKGTASEHRLPQIFEVAAQLERSLASEADWLEIMEFSSDLLELCRSTQKSYLLTCFVQDKAVPAEKGEAVLTTVG